MISSTGNAQLKRIQQLNQKAKYRREEQCFVAEGRKLFEETPEHLREKVYVSESFARNNSVMPDGSCDFEVVEDKVFQHVCDTKTPQGILTVVKMPQYTLSEILRTDNEKNPLLMILEDIQDPGNLGTILRTAEGAGVTGIIMSARTADVFQPKVTRSTMGSIFRVPFVRVTDIAETVQQLRAAGIRTYAAHLSGQRSYHKESYQGPTAFMIGNEGNGLSEELTAQADIKIRIPMEGEVESLNAAIASALLMYEAHNQRENHNE